MTQVRTVVLDNEAVQALLDVGHRKHRRVLAAVEAVTARNLRKSGSVQLVVPTTVRVEAGWDRLAPRAAPVNRLRSVDAALDAVAANRSVQIRSALGVSVTDAHLATVLDTTLGPHAVVTSETDDMQRIAAHLDLACAVVRV